MNRNNLLKILKNCEKNKEIVRLYFKYEDNYYYYIPLKIKEGFFLGAVEDDFLLDGYSVRRIKDIKSAELRDDLTSTIIKKEAILEKLVIPEIDLNSWENIFYSLSKVNKNIIIEDEYNEEFWIGKIIDINRDYVLFKYFDADGIWSEEPVKIGYNIVTSITFNSRYVDVFSKYV